LAIFSAILYLLAASAKEVYVPLIFVVLFLPEGGWKKRLKFASPMLTVVVLYSVWRFWMLGTAVGGYGQTMFQQGFSLAFIRVVAPNLAESGRMLWAGTPMGSMILLAVLAFLCVTSLRLLLDRRYGGLIFSLVLLSVAYLPLMPVLNTFSAGDFLSFRLVYLVPLVFATLVALSLEYCSVRVECPFSSPSWHGEDYLPILGGIGVGHNNRQKLPRLVPDPKKSSLFQKSV
jgi:hypothetical protein